MSIIVGDMILQVSLVDLLEDLGLQKIKQRGRNIQACCPYHNEKNPSWGISIDYPYLFNCFSCDSRGTLLNLVSDITGIPLHKVPSYLIKQYGFHRELSFIQELPFQKQSTSKNFTFDLDIYSINYPETFLQERGFTTEILQKFKIRYDENLQQLLIPWLSISGNVLFVKFRSLLYKAYFFTDNSEKRKYLYGIHLLNSGVNRIFLVEGEFDAIKCWQHGYPALAVGGSKISQEQIQLLKSLAIKEIFVLFDNDEVGRNNGYNIALQLAKDFFSYYCIYTTPKKDPCEFTNEDFKNLVTKKFF